MQPRRTLHLAGSPLATAVGISALVISTGIYSYEQEFMTFVTPERATFFAFVAEVYLLIFLTSVALVGFDVRRMAMERIKMIQEQGYASLSPVWLIPYVLSQKKYFRYFVASAILYGLFYAVLTSMIVYQPTVDFGEAYGAAIPSAIITPCCGAPLFAPVVTVYLVNHLGLLIIPLTALLLLAISTLVGVNIALTAFAFNRRSKGASRGWVGALGGVVGLFTGCPTCAGLFFANVLGGSGAVSFATLLAYYQPVFILLSLPVLLVTPYLVSRSLAKVFKEGCVYTRERIG